MSERCWSLAGAFHGPVLIAALLVVPFIAIEQLTSGAAFRTIHRVPKWRLFPVLATDLVAILRITLNRRRWMAAISLDVWPVEGASA